MSMPLPSEALHNRLIGPFSAFRWWPLTRLQPVSAPPVYHPVLSPGFSANPKVDGKSCYPSY
ncbi:MAG: hypothetical protein ACFFBV_00015 [Promethearchaeota archaeon]